jgi:hypothetical protein
MDPGIEGANSMDRVRGELLDIESGFWRAAGNPGYYETMVVDEGIFILPFRGGILDKHQTIRLVEQSPPWTDFSIDEPVLIGIDPRTIALTYAGRGQRNDQDDYHALVTSIYVLRDDGWRLILHQQTPIGP